jgi:ribosomal protein L12E/L44/L45/RPP1/RPP2
MTTSQASILNQAKQGDPKAIAALLNHRLKGKGIIAKVRFEENILQVLLESQVHVDESKLSGFVRQFVEKLNLKNLDNIYIFHKVVKAHSIANPLDELNRPEESIHKQADVDKSDLVERISSQIYLKLEKASGLSAAQEDPEHVKVLLEDLLEDIKHNCRTNNLDEDEFIEIILTALYIKAYTYFQDQDYSSALNALNAALSKVDEDNKNLEICESILKFKKDLEEINQKSEASPALVNHSQQNKKSGEASPATVKSKAQKKARVTSINSKRGKNELSTTDRTLIYISFLFLFSSTSVAILMGITLQVFLSLVVAAYITFCLIAKIGWHKSVLFSAATTFMFFPTGFYFTWKNIRNSKKVLPHICAAFIAFLLPTLLIATVPTDISTVEVSPSPGSSESNIEGTVSPTITSPDTDYPFEEKGVELYGREKYEWLGECTDEQIAQGASAEEILETCNPTEPEEIVPLSAQELEVIYCTEAVKDPSSAYYSDCLEKGY